MSKKVLQHKLGQRNVLKFAQQPEGGPFEIA